MSLKFMSGWFYSQLMSFVITRNPAAHLTEQEGSARISLDGGIGVVTWCRNGWSFGRDWVCV
jgi:hypothetical protein